jgi:hypothetical protein
MNSHIYKKYYAPQSLLKCWQIELDPGTARSTEPNSIRSHEQWFRDEEVAQVEAIIVFCDRGKADDIKTKISNFSDLRKFERLKYLSLPLDSLPYVDWNSLKDSLEHLRIANPRHGTLWEIFKSNALPAFPRHQFSSLKTLSIPCPPTNWNGFETSSFRNLEWIHVELDEFDKTGKSLKIFDTCHSLQGVGIDSLKGNRVLKNVRTDLSAIDIWSITSKTFDFSYFSSYENLKYLRIRGSASPIDCQLFANLPMLEEIEISSCKDVFNTQALLAAKKLSDIRIRFNNKTDLSPSVIKELSAMTNYSSWN